MTAEHQFDADAWSGVAAGDVLFHAAKRRRYVVADPGVGRGPVLVTLPEHPEDARPAEAVHRHRLPPRNLLTPAGRLDDAELQALLHRLDDQPQPIGKLTPGTVVRLRGDDPPRLAVLASTMTRTGLAYLVLPPEASYRSRDEFSISDPPFRRRCIDLNDPLVLTWEDIEERAGRLSQQDTLEMQQARAARSRRFKPQRGDLLWAWACFPPGRVEKVRPCIVLDIDDDPEELLVAPASSSPRTPNVLMVKAAQLEEPNGRCPDDMAVNLLLRIPLSAVAGRRVARVPQPLLDRITRRVRRAGGVRR